MKQLILTFFAVVLCYSLLFNDRNVSPAVDEVNYVYKEVSIPNYYIGLLDTFSYNSLSTTPVNHMYPVIFSQANTINEIGLFISEK